MSDTLTLTLVFHEREPAAIHRIAEESSDPIHPNYAKHLERAQLRPLIDLTADERAAIVQWLGSYGMSIVDAAGASRQLMFVRATRQQVTEAFGHELHLWLDKDTDNRGARVVLALPRRFAGYIQKVGGLPGEEGQMGRSISGFAGLEDARTAPERKSETSSPIAIGESQGPAGRHFGIAPADIRETYNFPDQWDGTGETIALMMLGGRLDETDLNTFWNSHGVRAPEVHTVQVGPIHAAPAHPLHTLEVAMSVEWVGAMAPGARIVVYFIDPTIMGDPWAAFLFAVISDDIYSPTIASTSWVTPERQYYRLHGHNVIAGLLRQATALGISVISASGDWGAFDGVPRTVVDGRYVCDTPWPHGVFPAVEEQVLSVGGTMVICRDPLTEIGWSGPPPPALRKAAHFTMMASSGGFSEDIPIPSWQRPVLRPYYSRGSSIPAVVPYGRGFPDVALMASGPVVQRNPEEPLSSRGYQAVSEGQWVDYAGGTSLAAQIWSAILARANQARRTAGQGRLGCVNPLLYRIRSAEPRPFREITQGNSDVMMNALNLHGRAVSYHLPGYECRAGWNPVTGLGVPDVAALIQAVCRRGES